MAKIRARALRKGRKFFSTYRNMALEKGRSVKSEVKIFRTSGGGREAFLACVTVGRTSEAWRRCATGRTPRKAIAAAMKQSAKHDVGTRRGAFAGIRRRKR